jgi:outer membrane usher protein
MKRFAGALLVVAMIATVAPGAADSAMHPSATPVPASAVAVGPAPTIAPAVADQLPAQPVPVAPQMSPVPDGKVLLGVSLNGSDVSDGTFLLMHGGAIFLAKDDALAWGLRLPVMTPLVDSGKEYFPLAAFTDIKAEIDNAKQALVITGSSNSFSGGAIDFRRPAPRITEQDPGYGEYLNYTLYGRGPSQGPTRGQFEFGLSLRHGTLRDTFFDDSFPSGRIHRIDTAYTSDDLAHRSTFTLGDSIAIGGHMATASRFVGVQYATNFSVDPTFIAYPIPVFYGNAALPGSASVSVNNSNGRTVDVPAGPYALQNLPLTDGAGNVQMLVTDVLGQQHLIVANYYQTRSVLKKGLTTRAFSAGFEREQSGDRSGHYGPLFTDATIRHGFSNNFTGEAHVEVAPNVGSVAAIDADLLVGKIGVLSIGLAQSTGRLGSGTKAILGYSYVANRFDVGLEDDRTTVGFHEIGRDQPGQQQGGQNQVVGHIGYRPSRTTSLSLSSSTTTTLIGPSPFTPFVAPAQANTGRYTSLTVSKMLGRRQLSLSMYRTSGTIATSGASIRLYMPLGGSDQVSLETDTQSGSGAATVAEFQHNGPANDFGAETDYDIYATPQNGGYYSFAMDSRSPHGDIFANIAKTGTGFGWQGSVSGAIVGAGRHLYATRQIFGSYGLIDVGFPNVRVYDSHRLLGVTNKRGVLLASDLQPYFGNDIEVDASDLPLDVRADAQVLVSPMLRSGVHVRIPTRVEHSALISLVDKDGKPLLAGMTVSDAANAGVSWPVAEDGAAFLSPIHSGKLALIATDGYSKCNAEVIVPAHFLEGSDLGKVVCLPTTVAVTADKR